MPERLGPDILMPKGATPRGVVGDLVPAAVEEPLIGHQPVEAHGSPGMDLTGRDAELRPEAVAVPVGEARARVVKDRGRVYLALDAPRRRGRIRCGEYFRWCGGPAVLLLLRRIAGGLCLPFHQYSRLDVGLS